MRRLLLSAVLLVAACGQTGDLVLPDKAAKKPAPAAVTPPPAVAPAPAPAAAPPPAPAAPAAEDEKPSETPATPPPSTP